jgi:hypothetical protein
VRWKLLPRVQNIEEAERFLLESDELVAIIARLPELKETWTAPEGFKYVFHARYDRGGGDCKQDALNLANKAHFELLIKVDGVLRHFRLLLMLRRFERTDPSVMFRRKSEEINKIGFYAVQRPDEMVSQVYSGNQSFALKLDDQDIDYLINYLAHASYKWLRLPCSKQARGEKPQPEPRSAWE